LIANKPEAGQQAKERPVPSVEVLEIRKEDLHLSIPSQGTVTPRRHIQLVTEVRGAVKKVSENFLEGSLIEAGAPLLVIDDTDYQAAVAEAKSNLLNAQLNYKDKAARYQNESLAVRQAKAQQVAFEKKLAQAEKDLANTRVIAPFNAVVEKKHADLGQFISTGTTVAVLSGTDQVEIRLPVHQNDLSLIAENPYRINRKINVTLRRIHNDNEHTWSARIHRIEGNVDSRTRVYQAIAVLDDPYGLSDSSTSETRTPPLPIGMFVSADIESRKITSAVQLPRSSVHFMDGNIKLVYLLNKDNTLSSRKVTVLREAGETVVIRDGIENGDKVIVTPLAQVWEGMNVKVVAP
jgi:RND family efflux transporter MFP subunit